MKTTNRYDFTITANAFASTFYFLQRTMLTHKKIKRACKPTHCDSATLTRQTFGQKRRTTGNMGLAIAGGQCVIERLCFLFTFVLADSIGYHIVLAEKQNYYPDLSFVHKDNDQIKFAVDIKTTFRRNDSSVGFTLGSHGAYFIQRDKSKNIQFPYNQYSGHFVLGVIYSRVDFNDEKDAKIYRVDELKEGTEKAVKKVGARQVTEVKNLKSIASVIRDFDFFAAEKWKIASDFQGSHNTANIGCVIDLEDLKNENGAFSKLGEDWFDEYWQNYGHITHKDKKITNLKDYLDFKGKPELWKKITTKILRNK